MTATRPSSRDAASTRDRVATGGATTLTDKLLAEPAGARDAPALPGRVRGRTGYHRVGVRTRRRGKKRKMATSRDTGATLMTNVNTGVTCGIVKLMSARCRPLKRSLKET